MVADEWWSYHAAESLQIAEESLHVAEWHRVLTPGDALRNAFRIISEQ